MTPAIDAFWKLWAERRDALERGITDGTLQDHVPAVSDAVAAIHPDLQWEMGQGLVAEHYFCLAAPGNPALRVTAERWRASAPPSDGVFEFHASRPGGHYSATQELDFGVAKFGFGEFRFGMEWEAMRRRVHVNVFHPSFAKAPENLRGNALFIALDTTLGEDEVERWIGAVDVSLEPVPDGVDFAGLLAELERRRAEGSEPAFTGLEGQLEDGAPCVVLARLDLKAIDHLLLDHHYEVVLPLQAPRSDGLYEQAEGHRLDAVEEDLLSRLGNDAVYIGRETFRGQRVLHFHAASTGPVPSRLEAWSRELDDYDAQISGRHDPAWEVLRRW